MALLRRAATALLGRSAAGSSSSASSSSASALSAAAAPPSSSSASWCSLAALQTSSPTSTTQGARCFSAGAAAGDAAANPNPNGLTFEELSADKASYQTILDNARHQIFGTHIGDGQRSGRKVLRKTLVAERMADWYMQPMTKFDPIFADPKDDQKRQKLAALKRRGKGPPAKGQGKRSKKK